MVPVARVEEKGLASYWAVEQGRVLVGQTLAEVVNAMRNPRPNLGALAAMAGPQASVWVTPFEGVHRLTFGHELYISDGEPRVRRWLYPERTAPTSDDPVAVMREAIRGAVGRLVAGDAGRGLGDDASGESGATVALSGGLDSTILLALAALDPQLRRGLRAYCAVPEPRYAAPVIGRTLDEWSDAQAVAERVGVPIRRMVSGEFNWLDEADHFHARNLAPILVPGTMWWLCQLETEAAKNGHRMILTGQSGNATFSHGPLSRIPRLMADGTREKVLQRRVKAAAREALTRTPPTAVRRGFSIEIPEHVLDLDPWTRWCFAEPPGSAHGPWTGADVLWTDPLGSPEVITAAMSLPASAWGTRVSDRLLARQVGVGLIPEQVRLNRVRGIQGTDLPGLMLRHAGAYQRAVQRVGTSSTAKQFLNVQVLRRGVDRLLVRGDLKSARQFHYHLVRPLSVGLFAAWWDENR